MAILNRFRGFMQVDRLLSTYGALCVQQWTNVAAANTTLLKSAQATSNSATTTVTSFSAQPDFPRNIVITPGGTTTDVPAGDVTVTGTNIRGETISETFTFAANASSAVTGNKAFKTVTSVVFPIQDGAAATYDIGTGVKLGLDRKLPANTVILATTDGAYEATRPTVAYSSSAVESNTISTNTAPNGTRDFIAVFVSKEVTTSNATTS